MFIITPFALFSDERKAICLLEKLFQSRYPDIIFSIIKNHGHSYFVIGSSLTYCVLSHCLQFLFSHPLKLFSIMLSSYYFTKIAVVKVNIDIHITNLSILSPHFNSHLICMKRNYENWYIKSTVNSTLVCRSVFLSSKSSWMMGIIFPAITWITTYILYLLRAQVIELKRSIGKVTK